MDKPLFSIITVCFNSQKTIERTIKSVLQQSFKDYEYIIVDGVSTDGTLDIINKYIPLFNGRMKVKSEVDNGIYDAFNKGIKRSCGKYVWIVNSDDYIAHNALEILEKKIRTYRSNCPIICGSLRYFEENTGKTIRIRHMNNEGCRRAYRLDQTNVIHPATIVPKSVYEQHGSYDERYSILADCEWSHRVYSQNVSVEFIDEIITNMSNCGISGTYSWNRYKKSHADRNLYFKKYYSNYFIRYVRFIFWDLCFMRQAIKLWISKVHFRKYN